MAFLHLGGGYTCVVSDITFSKYSFKSLTYFLIKIKLIEALVQEKNLKQPIY